MPKRIQRKRTKDWRMPEGAIYVGRGSRWGNPFAPGMHQQVRMSSVKLRPGDTVNGLDQAFRGLAISLETALSLYRDALQPIESPLFEHQPLDVTVDDVRALLAGRDLACWCPLDQPCHGDILLKLANGGVR